MDFKYTHRWHPQTKASFELAIVRERVVSCVVVVILLRRTDRSGPYYGCRTRAVPGSFLDRAGQPINASTRDPRGVLSPFKWPQN
jgi:hypothetical protein